MSALGVHQQSCQAACELVGTPDVSNACLLSCYAALMCPAGSRINYTYTISNPGNVMVRNIVVSAPGVGPLTCNSTSTGVAAPSAGFTNMTVYQVVVCK